MIPKIIHYCWLSNDPIPESLQKCMESWKTYLPDYQFIHWNFERFDKDSSLWVKQAFENKKYAFAADYIRLYALYHYGGIYLDMDVEVIKSFDPFLPLKTILCYESYPEDTYPEVAAFGVEKEADWIKECLEYYCNREFITEKGEFNTTPLPQVIKKILEKRKYKFIKVSNIDESLKVTKDKNIGIFTSDFFSPKSYKTNVIKITQNTICIHHFAGTWTSKRKYEIQEEKFWKKLGMKNLNIINKIRWFPKNLYRIFTH